MDEDWFWAHVDVAESQTRYCTLCNRTASQRGNPCNVQCGFRAARVATRLDLHSSTAACSLMQMLLSSNPPQHSVAVVSECVSQQVASSNNLAAGPPVIREPPCRPFKQRACHVLQIRKRISRRPTCTQRVGHEPLRIGFLLLSMPFANKNAHAKQVGQAFAFVSQSIPVPQL